MSSAVQDPTVADLEYGDWEGALAELREREIVDATGKNPRDWFAQANLDDFLEVFVFADEIHTSFIVLSRQRRDIQNGYEMKREWEAKDFYRELESLKESFQELFSILSDVAEVSMNNLSTWVVSKNKSSDLEGLSQRYKPHKKQETQRTRLEAKRFAILGTYIDPLLQRYTPERALKDQQQLAKYLEDLEQVVESFLKWLWKVYEMLVKHAEIPDATPQDVAYRILKQRKGHPDAPDEVSFTDLQGQVSRELDQEMSASQLLIVLSSLSEERNDLVVRVWEEGEDPVNAINRDNLPLMEDLTVEAIFEEEPRFTEITVDHIRTLENNLSFIRGI